MRASAPIFDFTGGPIAAAPITLWHTRDAGRHWNALDMPRVNGTFCQVEVTGASSQRVIISVFDVQRGAPTCANTSLYVSDDGGDSWRFTPHTSVGPAATNIAECFVWATGQYLYIESYFSPIDQVGAMGTMIYERGDGQGRWTRIGQQFGADAHFHLWPLGDGDTLLASVIHATGFIPAAAANDSAEIWLSRDSGDTWTRTGSLPDVTLDFLVPTAPGEASPSAAHPLYSLGGDQIPPSELRLRLQQSSDARVWTPIPPLPVPGVDATHAGLLKALGVTLDGEALAFGVDPMVGVSHFAPTDDRRAITTNPWVWLWNPRQARWVAFDTPLQQPTLDNCPVRWSSSVSYGAQGNTRGTYALVQNSCATENAAYRIFIPADDS